MSMKHLPLLALALTLGAASGGAQRGTAGGSVALQPSLESLPALHDELAAEFRRLADAATAASATARERVALARFVRQTIVPRLKTESFALITAFDSVVGGGYAVPATLFDLDAIGFLVREIERTAGGGSPATFNERAYALSVGLEGYFTKMDVLVLPVLRQRLTGQPLSAVVERLDRRPR